MQLVQPFLLAAIWVMNQCFRLQNTHKDYSWETCRSQQNQEKIWLNSI